MKALIDGDILRYEIGYGAETGWKTVTEGVDEGPPPFDYVINLFHEKVNNITALAGADSHEIYITQSPSFRYEIAKTKPYKGNRHGNKPYHFDNLSAYINSLDNCIVSTAGLEADDEIGTYQTKSIFHGSLGDGSNDTIICSRDKDLRQVPGWHYTWELGNQPSYGPLYITELGELTLIDEKVVGNGYLFFCYQMIVGDSSDNIPGLPKKGPVYAMNMLAHCNSKEEADNILINCYKDVMGDQWEEYMIEQGNLLWIIRDGEMRKWIPPRT